MLYLILCLMCRLQIISEDCLIKLIYLSLQCCCDRLLLLFCWAYVSGYMPFMSSGYVHLLCLYSLNVACLLAFNKCTVHRISNEGSRTTGVYSIAGYTGPV